MYLLVNILIEVFLPVNRILMVISPFNIADGSLCFDFAITLDARRAPQTVESLTNYADLVDWAARVGIVEPTQARDLLAKADGDPAASRAVLTMPPNAHIKPISAKIASFTRSVLTPERRVASRFEPTA